jgi:hypothetical protein
MTGPGQSYRCGFSSSPPDSARRDPAIATIDTELRLFKFSGYELIGEGTATIEEATERDDTRRNP